MALPTAESNKLTRALSEIGAFLSIAAIFVLLSFAVPGISHRYQHLCWQTALLALFATAVTIKRNLVVWYPVIYHWCVRLARKSKAWVPPAGH